MNSQSDNTSKDQPVDELHSQRKVLADFLKGGTLTDGSVNPNTLNTLQRYIQAECNRARKEALEVARHDVDFAKRWDKSLNDVLEVMDARLQQLMKGGK